MDRKKLLDQVYKYGTLGFYFYEFILNLVIRYRKRGGDAATTIRKYKKVYGKSFDLNSPQTLNEKILWLKLNDHRAEMTICADKYTVREYLEKRFGKDLLIPLLYVTDDWRNLTFEKIPDTACIIKASHSQGDMLIVKDKSEVDVKKLRFMARTWMKRNLYDETQEWQYKHCKPRIIIEKLLQCKNGYIPNDYKLHYINGELAFVYCTVGRETVNKRNIYDVDWNPLYFSWVEPYKDSSTIRGEEIEAPVSFEEMKRIGSEIAKDYPYVRVDFYDVDGKLYFGEITFHHGSGFDVFKPAKYDLLFGEKLQLPQV